MKKNMNKATLGEIFRSTSNQKEIHKLLSSISKESQFTIWQKSTENDRTLLSGLSFSNFSIENIQFSLCIKDHDFSKFNIDQDIFFLLDNENLTFKSKVKSFKQDEVIFKIPLEIKTIEKRNEKRIEMDPNKKEYSNILFALKKTDALTSTTCPILNISLNGLSVVITKETLSIIDVYKELLVEYNAVKSKAIIKNIRVYKRRELNKDELYAVGLLLLN